MLKKERTLNLKIKNTREEKAITLIALVITIIVLLILAGVTITALSGDNGILTRAADAKEQTEIADEKEKVNLSAIEALTEENGGEIAQDVLDNKLGNYFENGKYVVEPGTNEDETDGYIVTITEHDPNGRKYFVDKNGNVTEYTEREPAQPTEGLGKDFDMSYGVIEIEFLSGTSYNTTTIPNHPILKEGMTAITYNENDGTTQNVSNSSGTDWYSYIETTDSDMSDGGTTNGGNSHWANAKVTVDNVDSYFVWIPRYAYRIIYFDSENSENAYRAGTLTEDKALANNQIIGYSDARGIVDTEGRTKRRVSVQTAISVNDKYFKTHPAFEKNVDYGGWSSKLEGMWVAKYEASQVRGTTTPKFEPGVNSSWKSITIGDVYTYAYTYARNLESHMLKNSEWGAVAYLTESKYGRNGTEITANSSSEDYTGGGSGTAYVSNTNQSSTGNIYGVYDLSGGEPEFVAGYNREGNGLTYGSSFTDGTSNQYATAYDGSTPISHYKYGDATYETFGWNGDSETFATDSQPFFARGSFYGKEGIFSVNQDFGHYGTRSFRVCLVV